MNRTRQLILVPFNNKINKLTSQTSSQSEKYLNVVVKQLSKTNYYYHYQRLYDATYLERIIQHIPEMTKIRNKNKIIIHVSPLLVPCVLCLASCALRLAPCALRLASCALRLAPCALRLAPCVLRLAYCVLRIAYCVLRIAYCVLRIAYCVLFHASLRTR